MDNSLRISLFGSIHIEADGRPLDLNAFSSRKDLALFCYLVVSAGPVPRMELATLFWPDKPKRPALNNLNRVLSQLRKQFPECLWTNAYEIAFQAPYPVWVDCHAFAELEQIGDSHALAQAADLYEGEFMAGFHVDAGFDYETWLTEQREHWHQRAAAVLRQLTDYYLFAGPADVETGLQFAARLLDLQPWRESAHRRKMRFLARLNQISAALMQYKRCQRILASEFGVEPSLRTRNLYRQILAARERQIPPLPAARTGLVGRAEEVRTIARLLADPPCRLITLTGSGGVGKTRLAQAVAEVMRDVFLGGVYYISLGGLQSSHHIWPALLVPLEGMTGSVGPPAERVLAKLKNRETLFILDGYDDFTDSIGVSVIDRLLSETPLIKIIVTSRERLRLFDERVVEVSPLNVTDPQTTGEQAWESSSAVQLFVNTATLVQTDFAPTRAERQAIQEICRLLDGLPLGIELAASWVRTTSCQQIADALKRGFDFLSERRQGGPRRQLSLEATFEYSWLRLTSQQQSLLGRLTVFSGGFNRRAAQNVAGASLDDLSELVDRSLLKWRPEQQRYEMHNSIQHFARLYALEELRHSGIEERHCTYFLEHLQRRDLGREEALSDYIVRVTSDIDNLHGAWFYAVKQGKLVLLSDSLSPLWLYYDVSGQFEKARELLQLTARLIFKDSKPVSIEEKRLLSIVLAQQSWFCFHQGYCSESQNLALQSARLLASSYDEFPSGWPLLMTGINRGSAGHYRRARKDLAQALEGFRRNNNEVGMLLARRSIGQLALASGDPVEARWLLEESVHTAKSVQNCREFGLGQIILGQIDALNGEYARAEKRLQAAFKTVSAIGDRYGQAACCFGYGYLACMQSQGDEALRWFDRCLELARQLGERRLEATTRIYLGEQAFQQDNLQLALESFRIALELAHELSAPPIILQALIGLLSVTEALGNLHCTPQIEQLLLLSVTHPASDDATQRKATGLLKELDCPREAEPTSDPINVDDAHLTSLIDQFFQQAVISS